MNPTTFDALLRELPALVARNDLPKYGWPFGRGHMANCDSAGTGPAGRIRCGRKVVYTRDALVAWLAANSEPCEERRAA